MPRRTAGVHPGEKYLHLVGIGQPVTGGGAPPVLQPALGTARTPPGEGEAALAVAGAAFPRPIALFFLTFSLTLPLFYRPSVNILDDPIREEFQTADWQIGRISGPSLSFLFIVSGNPPPRSHTHTPALPSLMHQHSY